ncbi:hypothetical protein NQ318_007604 [Aromia moschata]|uniref:PiggyBac transposable element-derived protein domain-containing protein n=1 Tax=Aromia moschata TaxID=1265417 RepID=A0AAV8YAR2_9CUCU|nr:hypothetical protein NQ318_007604 [Aromia moschata]
MTSMNRSEPNAHIPSDSGSDNDSNAEDCQNVVSPSNQDLPDGNVPEYVLSGTDDDSNSEWDAEDLQPLAQVAARIKIEKQISWEKKVTNIRMPIPFTEDTGLPQFIKNLSSPSPLEIFSLLIADDIIDHIVFQTNLYAEQEFIAKGKTYKKTNPDEIKAFLGINLLMGIKQYSSYRDHWSTAPDLHDPYISRIMTIHHVPLLEDLLQQQIYACGTVNSTRQKLPKFKSDKELKRGEYDWYCSNSGLSAVKWRDKRSVHLLSNYHDPSSGTEVKRKKKMGHMNKCLALLCLLIIIRI